MKDKTVAALLAIFLGWIGIHKFYLGQNGKGLVYLIVGVTPLAFVTFMISVCQGIGLLMTSQDAFDYQFNRRLKMATSPVSPILPAYSTESTKDKAGAIYELKKLYDTDLITAEEYEEKRRKILDSI
ncbi:MAG: NINE protein [Phormidesmis sp.]